MLNNRAHKKWLLTLTLTLWLGVLWQPPGFAGRSINEISDPPVCRSGMQSLVLPPGMLLADNHSTDKETVKTGTSDSGAAEDKTAADNKNKTKKEGPKTKPLKTFVPTEKVKADQAVDFPYDI